MKGRLERGQRLLKLKGPRPVSLMIGVTAADLKAVENSTRGQRGLDNVTDDGEQRGETGFNKDCEKGLELAGGGL